MTLTEAREIVARAPHPQYECDKMPAFFQAKGFIAGHKAALESAAKIARNYPCYSKTLPCGTDIAGIILELGEEETQK